MATVELVMCPACGHPQEAAGRCVQCGAPLPAPLASKQPEPPKTARRDAGPPPSAAHAPAEAAPEPKVRLGARTLQVAEGQVLVDGAPAVPLEEVAKVSVSSRPLFEGLVVAALFALAAAAGQDPSLRMLFAGLSALCVGMALSYRRVALVVHRRSGTGAGGWTITRKGSAAELRLSHGISAFRRAAAGPGAMAAEERR